MGIKSSKKKTGLSKDECSTESNNHLRSIDFFRSSTTIDQKFVEVLDIGKLGVGRLEVREPILVHLSVY